MGEKITQQKSNNKERIKGPDAEMNNRMTALLHDPGNLVCADCPAKRPLWASFFATSSGGPKHLGVFCCSTCAQHHHFELGERRCRMKYLKMSHEWTLEDIIVLEGSGNTLINRVFEANLTEKDFEKSLVLESEEEEDARRTKFIKHKYKKRKYVDELMFHELVLAHLKQQRRAEGEEDITADTVPSTLEISIPEDSLTSIGAEDRQGSSSEFGYTHKEKSKKKEQQQRPSRKSSTRDFERRAKARARSRRHSLHDSCPDFNLEELSSQSGKQKRRPGSNPKMRADQGSRRKSTDASLVIPQRTPDVTLSQRAEPMRSASNPNLMQQEELSKTPRQEGAKSSARVSPKNSFRSRRASGLERSPSNQKLMTGDDDAPLPIIRKPRKRDSTNLRAFHSSFNRSFSMEDDSSSLISTNEELDFEADDTEELKILQNNSVEREKKAAPTNRLMAMADDFIQHTIQDMGSNSINNSDTIHQSPPTKTIAATGATETKGTKGTMRRSGSKSNIHDESSKSPTRSSRGSRSPAGMRRVSSKSKLADNEKSPKDNEKKLRRRRSDRKLGLSAGNRSMASLTSNRSGPKDETNTMRRTKSDRKLSMNGTGSTSMSSLMSGGSTSSIKRDKKAALSALKASLLADADGKRRKDPRNISSEKKIPVRVLPL